MNFVAALLFWLSNLTGALTGAQTAADAGQTFGPVFDPSLTNCEVFEDYEEPFTLCLTFPSSK